MTDLGPLLAAVTDDWETAKTIADRAGIGRRCAGQKLASLAAQGFVAADSSQRFLAGAPVGERVTLYRRGPKAPPLTVPLERRILPAANTLVAIGSIVRHVEEMLSPDGHDFDRHAVEALVGLEDVQAWLATLEALALLPVRRGS